MPGIDDLLRAEGEHWRAEVDTHQVTTTMPDRHRPRRPWSTTRGRVWTVSLAGVAAAAVVVLAVGLGTDSGGSGSTSAGGGQVAGAASSAAAAAPGALSRLSPLSAGKNAAAAVPMPASDPSSAASPVSSAALILTGSVALTVRTNAAVDRAATLATGITDGAGGRVDADTRSSSTQHSATLILRVPNAALPGVTKQVAGLGTVRSQNLQTRDVTTQVADVNSRVTSARASIASLTRLYTKAKSVSELIAVESALSSRQSNLEALEAQQRTLAAQTGLATLTLSVDVRTPAAKHHAHHSSSGFTGGLHSGWHAFTRSLQAIATGIGAVLPFLAVVLLLAAAALLVVRRRRRPVPATDPES